MSISGKQQCFEVMLEPCCPLGFLALYIMPLIRMESEHMGGAELILAAIRPSSSSVLRTKGHVGLRLPFYMTSTEGEDCLDHRQAVTKLKVYFLTSVPISVIHRARWTCQMCHFSPVFKSHHEMALGGLCLANRSCQETGYTEMVSLACLESSF